MERPAVEKNLFFSGVAEEILSRDLNNLAH